MRLIANVIGMSHDNFPCNSLTTVQDIQDYASLIFWDTVPLWRGAPGDPPNPKFAHPRMAGIVFCYCTCFQFLTQISSKRR